MKISFYKYQGAGNDFIMIDGRDHDLSDLNTETIYKLCDRHFGIGADGLILLKKSKNYDFRMIYYNSDGKEGTMCGNGGRCAVLFAKNLKIISEQTEFEGIDGYHAASLLPEGIIRLKMIDVSRPVILEDGYLLETGSRHFVIFSENIKNLDVYSLGRKIRNEKRFEKEGTNVNFVEPTENGIKIRTYERGVENETLACGTGSVAAAISAYLHDQSDIFSYNIFAPGGNLKVSFEPDSLGNFKNIWLEGPARYVFKGSIEL